MSGSSGHLSEETYGLMVAAMPILCVDVLPRFVDRVGSPFLLISRRDHSGHCGWCTVGGRVWKDERFEAAVARHVEGTLGHEVSWTARDWTRPDLVVDFEHARTRNGPHDGRKRSVSLEWVVDFRGDPVAGEEAEGVEFFTRDRLPPVEDFGFGAGRAIRSIAGLA